MSSIVDTLLRSETTGGGRRAPRSAPRSAPRRSYAPTGLLSERKAESLLKENILNHRGPVSLNEAQVRVLQRMLERLDFDPFANGGTGKIDTDDLEKLGLDTAEGDEGYEGDPFGGESDFGDHGVSLGEPEAGVGGLINPSAAIVAPVATPDHDRDIPDEVLQTQRVLQSTDDEVDISAVQQQDSSGSSLRQALQQGSPGAEPGGEPGPQPGAHGTGGSTPAEMADAIRQNMQQESRGVSAPLTEPKPAPAAPPATEEDGSGGWSSIMGRLRAAHRGSNVNQPPNPQNVHEQIEADTKKAQFKQTLASLAAGIAPG